MDPNANLNSQLYLAQSIIDSAEDDPSEDGEGWQPDPNDVLELAELVLALHEWRSKGGFDPYSK